jgi:hypothetical protein
MEKTQRGPKRSRWLCRLAAISFLLVCEGFAGSATAGESSRNGIPVRVDERVELLSIVFRSIDAFEYRMTPATETYAKEVDAYFGIRDGRPTPQRSFWTRPTAFSRFFFAFLCVLCAFA